MDDQSASRTATDAQEPAGASATEAPQRLGPYQLLRCIGEGGMGQVWLADQLEPLRRQVAVKIIKAGMDTRRVVARFEAERQALALMNHPAIARVFDGGSTSAGRPYFVMEYIEGQSITAHCDRYTLSTSARLELLCEVCAGVQHAHQKAIIHRDLKPSNILVAVQADRAQPKIIDFGIAKALGPQVDQAPRTLLGAVIGTPEYMSPEQADPSATDIDTRTDVYSLGVILYELLTGELPFGAALRDDPSADALRRKRSEFDAPRPSARISTPGPASTEAARKRGTDPGTLRKTLRGDLDAITLKALERDRARRYGTPLELAADLQRSLRSEPVLAQAPSAGYRARKFLQRNRVLVTGAAAIFCALLAGVIVSAAQTRRARAAEQRATAEAAVARATSDFLENELLGQADVGRQLGAGDPDLELRTVLDRAAVSLAGKFDQQPEVEASRRTTIANGYLALGLYAEARTQLEQALRTSTLALGEEDPRTLDALAALANVALGEGRAEEAEALQRRVLAGRRRALGSEHPDTVRALKALAETCRVQHQDAEAEALSQEASVAQRRVGAP